MRHAREIPYLARRSGRYQGRSRSEIPVRASRRGLVSKVHAVWESVAVTATTMCGHPDVIHAIAPAAFMRVERLQGYAHVCRHCSRNLHKVATSLGDLGTT